jgi:hypothetical protein
MRATGQSGTCDRRDTHGSQGVQLMRRTIVGIALLAALGALLALPLTTSSGSTRLSDRVRGGLDRTLTNVNTVAAKLREQQRKLREQLERERLKREAARRARANASAHPRAATPGPNGTAYTPPMHGTNPHGQGTVAVQDLPPSSLRPMPSDTKGGNGEILVAGRGRGEQLGNGTYHGHITVAGLLGTEVVGVNSNPGESHAGPLDPIQMGLLTPLCDATANSICLNVLTADSATTGTGSTNTFSVATAAIGGPTGLNAGVATSHGNISETADCQEAHGDSNVADATVGGAPGLHADAIEATTTSRECKDGTQTQTNTSKVVNLQSAGVAVPPLISQNCANGVPDTPALINVLLPAVCNADDSSQAGPVNGVREGLTAFVLDIAGTALTKTTTAASESRAVKKAQCSDGVDNDGDGKIDFPADPGCSSATDDSEADNGGIPECRDGVDNDGDGKIDFPDDPGCSSRNDDSEAGGGGAAQCNDGKDNDGDGKIDFPDDPGCSSTKDDSEAGNGSGTAGAGAGGGTQCSDGVDNDGDGKIDFPADPGCSSAQDDSEGGNGGTQCSDGVDNDGDGLIDFPNDPGCSSASDDSESGNNNGLAFTGTNVVLAGLIGALLLLMGLGMRTLMSNRTRLAPGQGPGGRGRISR